MITDNPRLAGVGQDDFLARRRVPLRRLRVHAPSSWSISQSSCRALSGAEVDQEEAARHREEVEARHREEAARHREEVEARHREEAEARRREESEAHHREARRWEEVEATPLVSSQHPHWRESECL